MELCIDRLTKQYENKIAVDRVSLQLTNGVYGLLGANGAGKTTFMRMLCGILKPTSGTVTFDGMDVSSEEYRAELGYLPQDFGYYPDFNGMDFLLYMASLKGLTKTEAKRKSKKTSGIGEPFRRSQKENCDLFRRHEAKAWYCTGTFE